MAFNSGNRQQSNQGPNESWKAQGFVNLTLNLPNSAPIRLPSLALTGEKYGKLIDFLAKDPGNAAKLIPLITAEYRSATPVAKDFDFTGL